MQNEEDYQDMKDYLDLQSDEVRDSCRIVTPEMMSCNFALRIDKNVPNVFVPRMPRSAMPSENDSCPRVSVAATLLGCHIGYFRAEKELQNGSFNKPGTPDPFLGGYIISKIDFSLALLPNERLVGDSDSTEEMWLVAYSPEHHQFKPIPVGKMFIAELVYIPVSNRHPQMRLTYYITHNEPQGLWLNKSVKLEPGCYRVIVHWPSIWQRNIHNEEGVVVQQIDQTQFDEHKQLSAAMLNYQDAIAGAKPAYLNW